MLETKRGTLSECGTPKPAHQQGEQKNAGITARYADGWLTNRKEKDAGIKSSDPFCRRAVCSCAPESFASLGSISVETRPVTLSASMVPTLAIALATCAVALHGTWICYSRCIGGSTVVLQWKTKP